MRLRGWPAAGEDARPRIAIRLDGTAIEARAGDTVLAALVANGSLDQSTGKDGRPRGAFCGMGVCHECLVTIDGRASQRACLTKAENGMDVRRRGVAALDLAAASTDLAPLPEGDPPTEEWDVVVVGAGPGGLSAALAAAEAHLRVVVLDERPAPGGQFYKQPAAGLIPGRGDRQFRDGADLIARVLASGAEIRSETLVWGAERAEDGRIALSVLACARAGVLAAKATVIATGAYERPLPIPGWTLPGVMTTGAAQTIARSYGVAPGQRVLIAGNGPLNIQVAGELVRGGVTVVAVGEAAPSPFRRPLHAARLLAAHPRLAAAGLGALGRLHGAGVPVLFSHVPTQLEGRDRVERVTLVGLRPDGSIDIDRRVIYDVDAVALGFGFAPANELARLLGCRHVAKAGLLEVERDDFGRTSVPGVSVVGEAGGFGGAHIALAQGALAGRTIARALGRRVTDDGGAARFSLARHRRFQAALWSLFDARLPGVSLADRDTLVCRCEALTRSTLEQACRERAITDVSTLKRLTRAGMGRCQGRYCGQWLSQLVANAPPASELDVFAPQAPLRPVALSALAAEKPEWGGHKRAPLSFRVTPAGKPLRQAPVDTLIIGAGIAGLSTALFLARKGHNCSVVDRSFPNAGASGANAGSLHAQLLSYDFGAKAEAGGSPQARTLSLQADSIRLWQQLEGDLGRDLEIKITGGMMLAEEERGMRFLEEKARIDRENGVDCHIIGANEVRDREPMLAGGFRGAAWCPLEGRINPLIATHAILDAIRTLGVPVHAETEVRAIARAGNSFEVTTSRGVIRAGRVVNAAGAFAAQIAEMVGIRLPVFPAPLQMIVTEPAAPAIGTLISHADRHLSLKQAANGTFVIGGGWTAGLDPVHHHPRPLRHSIEGNLWVAQRVLPALRKLHVFRTWAAMNVNIDGAPILGEHPRVPGFFNTVTSSGYTLGPVMGESTAELILAGRASRDIKPFGVERFGA